MHESSKTLWLSVNFAGQSENRIMCRRAIDKILITWSVFAVHVKDCYIHKFLAWSCSVGACGKDTSETIQSTVNQI